MIKEKKYDAVGIGNAIVDILANVEEDFLIKQNLKKGIMKLIDESEAKRLHDSVNVVKRVSGGSAANTIVGLSFLGDTVAFIGKIRNDSLGKSFEQELKVLGINYCTLKAEKGESTASCLVLTTPDAQRTMNTCLGVSGSLCAGDIDETIISESKIIYLEGYLWDKEEAREAFIKAVKVARKTGGKVALSLSDPYCVDRHRREFLDLIENFTDIIFANKDEIKSLFEVNTLNEAISRCSRTKNICAVTRSEKGSVIICGDEIHMIPAEKNIKAVDTNGAGDLYAAGFIHGLIKGMDLASCGRIGSITAAEAVSHLGARPEVSLIKLVKEKGF